ncbi:hypothetical protein PMAYCL1PPCAC_29183 [Pristionchus mayeri]|uniref:Macro domain-containing protein n=1 Tax=Pristionchus mayeri TaxID=1317129 RepID=A0AAN5D9F5_9BILA|nr:hypothetical protein PMAYCL1PPCAC_29183 [Pristionchus mayeri]
MKSPLSKLCCISKQDPESVDEPPVDEVAQEVIAEQPSSVEDVAAEVVNHDAPSTDDTKKGHARTPSEASAPVARILLEAPATMPSEISLSSSSTCSYKSSESVQTAFERSPALIREHSKESVVTAIERTPSPKASKKEDQGSKMTSPQSKEAEDSLASAKTSQELPTSDHSSHQLPEPESNASQEPQKGMSSDLELPEDVTTLDEVSKLNEIIDGKKFDLKHPFFDKISLFYGDITKIQVDAIVNAANDRLGGGGGVDGAIHRAAGHNQLQAECRKHTRPVPTGEAVVTDACKLSTHVKKIIHCVGPICYGGVTDEKRKKLESCYRRAIQLSEENDLRSIAFCCISTGIYGYDNKDAARTVLRFLWRHFNKEENVEKWDRIVLCLFMDVDKQCYKQYIKELLLDPSFFDDEDEEESENEEKKEEEVEEKEDGENEDEKKEHGNSKTEEKKDEDTKTKGDGEKVKNELESKEGTKTDDKQSKETDTKDSLADEDSTEKKEDTVTESERKADCGTGEGNETKKEEATTSTSNTSTSEEMRDESDGGKEGEKENHDIDGKEKKDEGMTNKKRALSEDGEDEPPIKRDKHERESSV